MSCLVAAHPGTQRRKDVLLQKQGKMSYSVCVLENPRYTEKEECPIAEQGKMFYSLCIVLWEVFDRHSGKCCVERGVGPNSLDDVVKIVVVAVMMTGARRIKDLRLSNWSWAVVRDGDGIRSLEASRLAFILHEAVPKELLGLLDMCFKLR